MTSLIAADTNTLTLFHGEGSNCCQRVKWSMAYKGIAHATVDIAPFSDEDMRALTPLGQVPCLKVGATSLTESMAIVEYLEEAFPATPLLPREPLQRARVRVLCEAANTFVHPMQRTRVVRHFVPDADKARTTALRVAWLEQSLAVVEAMLDGDGEFAVTGRFTLADIFLVPLYVKYVGMGGDAGRFGRLGRMVAACRADHKVLAAAPADLDLTRS